MSNYPHTVSVSSERGSVSLDGEQGKHLASVVINSSNIFLRTVFINSILNINFCCYFIDPFNSLYFCISELCDTSKTTCNCTCTCDTKSNGKFICLCLCNCTQEQTANNFCICVCNNQSKSSICICICKNGQNCCGQGSTHQCNQVLGKIDIGSLKDKSGIILKYLCCIRCCICKIENQSKGNNCSCSQTGPSSTPCQTGSQLNGSCSSSCPTSSQSQCCCETGRSQTCNQNCCCKEGKVDYESVLLRILSIDLIFKSITQKIPELLKLKNILSLICIFATKCAKCTNESTKELSSLITKIEMGVYYCSLFASRIKEIRPFVEYKFNSKKIQQILCSLQLAIQSLLLINTEILKDTVNPDYDVISNRLLLSVYSKYSIFQRYVSIYVLLQSSKIYTILYLVGWTDGCQCVRKLSDSDSNYKFYTIPFYSSFYSNRKLDLDIIKKIVNVGNHLCLCMTIKFILYPILYKYTNYMNKNINIGKIMHLMLQLVYKISKVMEYRYLWISSNIEVTPHLYCFCRGAKDKYYQYFISIILYLSSLIENIWRADNHSMVTAIQSLSNLYSELKIYDFNSIDKTKKISCGKAWGLLVEKKCGQEAAKKCCCWCVAIANLLLAYLYLCFQCALCKALCKNKEKLCNKIKDFCKIEELECKDPKKASCCLLKLALCTQLPNRCEELEKLLKKCCEACPEEACCKKILPKVKEGQADLLVIGCNCNCENKADQVKTWCALFKNLCGRSVAVVIVCKCQDPQKCCCLVEVIEKIKDELTKLCEECQCEKLKEKLQQLCADGSCCGPECLCKTLKTELEKICGERECLCKKIQELGTLCAKPDCQCKKEGCCRCVCCKLAIAGVRILTKACRQNFLEPYKRIVLDLLSGTDNKEEVMETIVNKINNRTLRITYLLKNVNLAHLENRDYKNIANSFPSLTVGYGYDSVYEHQISGGSYPIIKGFAKNYPSFGNPINY